MSQALRAISEYQIFGPETPETAREALVGMLEHGMSEGHLLGFVVDGVHQSAQFADLALCRFTVDFPLLRFDGCTAEVAQAQITVILNDVIGDSDVEVRWLERMA